MYFFERSLIALSFFLEMFTVLLKPFFFVDQTRKNKKPHENMTKIVLVSQIHIFQKLKIGGRRL